MQKIVFDLDYTLLDTHAFKAALIDATGVPRDAWEGAYKEAVAKKGFFEPDAFFDRLVEKGLLSDEAAPAAREQFEGVLTTTERYLYPQAKEMLLALAKHKQEVEVELMTFGEANWQRAKVSHSGLAKLFQDVHYVETSKKEFVKGLGTEGVDVILVNDNGKEMDEMIEAAPEHTYIWKPSDKPAPKDKRMIRAESIVDIAERLEAATGIELRREMREVREGIEAKTVKPGEDIRVEIDMGGDDEREERKEKGEKDDDATFDPGTKGPRRL